MGVVPTGVGSDSFSAEKYKKDKNQWMQDAASAVNQGAQLLATTTGLINSANGDASNPIVSANIIKNSEGGLITVTKDLLDILGGDKGTQVYHNT